MSPLLVCRLMLPLATVTRPSWAASVTPLVLLSLATRLMPTVTGATVMLRSLSR